MGIAVVHTEPEHAEQLEALQRTCFPALAPSQRFSREHYLAHIERFAEGQWVALDGTRVVGMTSTLRMDLDLSHPHHTFDEVVGGGWLTSHDPNGAWLYGVDIGTHPDYRRRGIARSLYDVRQSLVRDLGLRGQATVGMLSGYATHRDRMDIERYYEAVATGDLTDPTVSMQIAVGFEVRGLIRGYLDDPCCDGCGALLVRQ